VLQQLAEHPLRGIAGGRKADALRTGDDAVFTADHGPRESTKGPPELPGLSAASVWMTSSISRPVSHAGSVQGTDDAGRDRVLEAERIARWQWQLADPQRGGGARSAGGGEDFALTRMRARSESGSSPTMSAA